MPTTADMWECTQDLKDRFRQVLASRVLTTVFDQMFDQNLVSFWKKMPLRPSDWSLRQVLASRVLALRARRATPLGWSRCQTSEFPTKSEFPTELPTHTPRTLALSGQIWATHFFFLSRISRTNQSSI